MVPPELPYKKGPEILFFHHKLLRALISLFLILVPLAAFWQVQNNEFINLDDNLYVTDNPNVLMSAKD